MSQNSISTYFFTQLLNFISPLCAIDNIADFESFKKAVERYTFYTFSIDALIDTEIDFDSSINPTTHRLVKAHLSNTRSLRTLATLFNKDSNFWIVMDNYMSAYYTGLVLEKQNSSKNIVHNLESFKSYALAKHAPAFVPSSGMLILFKSKTTQAELENMLTPLFYGMQMLDDLEDFDKDIQNNQLTYCISQVQEYIKAENLEVRTDLERFEERVFYLSGIAKTCNDFAEAQFTKAQQIAKDLGLLELVQWIDSVFEMLEHNRDIIDQVSK
ncbi:hypothetical protein ACFSYG_16725 [Leeuwenhoekiella polynyae]|uniref:Uncharacterized protein n=1 Tax=Leeuwenhoekiella polynyae TaxID=1550906 RepID=A0A4Q0P176_9FLAO|nr:hypothetical protein [Leeuwenhoekiella polynyae]RXG20224.1 hypothetical protein DSM02_2660 [Leeuwenhoekiella polynyae]